MRLPIIAGMRRLAGTFRRRRSFMVVQDPRTGAAFASDIDLAGRLHFARVFLGNREGHIVRRQWHLGDRASAAVTLARRHGLVVLPDWTVPADLRPALLRVPRFVALSTGLGDSTGDFLARLPQDRRESVRRLGRRGFRAVVSADPEWAAEFHARYHEPTVRRRHGLEGYVMPAHEIADCVRTGGSEFVQAWLGDKCVAAGTGVRRGSTYHFERIGWLDGDSAWLDLEADAAVIWFRCERARSLGCTRVCFGGTPPYLNDGVFRFKMRWNTELDPEATVWGDHLLLLDPRHGHVQDFLRHHAVIARDSAGRFVALSSSRPHEIPVSPRIRNGLAAWRRLLAPDEAVGSGLDHGPYGSSPSGWFVEEPPSNATGGAGRDGCEAEQRNQGG